MGVQLYNQYSNTERERMIEEAGEKRLTVSFYKYHKIANPQLFRNHLFIELNRLNILGRVYIATEGINAQISIPNSGIEGLEQLFKDIIFLRKVRMNWAIEGNNKSFLKLTIKVRSKIVADGLKEDSIDLKNKGKYVSATEFNTLLDSTNTICIDVRNHYESEIGHFLGAVRPDVDTFRESLPIIERQFAPDKQKKQFLLYCTGGIRCEKASAYLKNKGFEKVYQLEGGIINYIHQVKNKNIKNKFSGKNFVFDNRLNESASSDIIARCHQCGKPCDQHTNCANTMCHLLFIQCDDCKTSMKNCCSQDCIQVVELPESDQKEMRKNTKAGHKIFRKGRSKTLKFKK